jgi:serine/threonine protein kinase
MAILAPFVLDISTWKREKKCGAGNFASVYIYATPEGERRAVKCMDNEDPNIPKLFLREVTFLLALEHPAILPFCGFSLPEQGRSTFQIITEFMPNGTVQSQLSNEHDGHASPRWNDTVKSKVVFGVAAAMAHVHSRSIVHRDLKSENIFLDENWEPRVADFGLAKQILPEQELVMSAIMGTPLFMAPELFSSDAPKPSYPIDVYAYAVIVLSLFVKGDLKMTGMRMTSLPQLTRHILAGKRFEIPSYVPEKYKELIEECWKPEAGDRPTFPAIVERLNHPEARFPRTDDGLYEDYKKRVLSEQRESAQAPDAPDGSRTEPFNFD